MLLEQNLLRSAIFADSILELLLAWNTLKRLFFVELAFKGLSSLSERSCWRHFLTLLARLGTNHLIRFFLHEFSQNLSRDMLIELGFKLGVNRSFNVQTAVCCLVLRCFYCLWWHSLVFRVVTGLLRLFGRGELVFQIWLLGGLREVL